MTAIVELKGLTKRYGKTAAVEDISLAIEEKKIYGLLGRNGAGKTTVMHMITAQLFPTSGEVFLFGEPPYENNRVLTNTVFIKESQKYPDSYTVKTTLEAAALLYPDWDQQFAMELVELFRLPMKRRIKKLSRGMLSSVGIIIGLASRAPLTIFDEPYLGLDAVARSLFYDKLLEDYGQHPRTIILSTHLIDEVSQLLEHVIVIDNGRILLDEEADALRGRACSIAGQVAAVELFLTGRTVLGRETLGAFGTATILGELSPQEIRQTRELGLELSPVSLQQLIVHLTKHQPVPAKGGSVQ